MSPSGFSTTVNNVSLHCNQETTGLLQEGLKVTVEPRLINLCETSDEQIRRPSLHCPLSLVSAFRLGPASVCLHSTAQHFCLTYVRDCFRGSLCSVHSVRANPNMTEGLLVSHTNVVWHSAGRSACWLRSAGDTYNLPLNPASVRSERVPPLSKDHGWQQQKGCRVFCRRRHRRSFFSEATGTRWHLFFFLRSEMSEIFPFIELYDASINLFSKQFSSVG